MLPKLSRGIERPKGESRCVYEAVPAGQTAPGPFIIQETIGTGKTRASRALCKTSQRAERRPNDDDDDDHDDDHDDGHDDHDDDDDDDEEEEGEEEILSRERERERGGSRYIIHAVELCVETNRRKKKKKRKRRK